MPVSCEEASCQMDGQCIRSIRDVPSDKCMLFYKAKTWNTIHLSCFFQIKMTSRTYILPDLPRDSQFRICCSNTNSRYSHCEGLGQRLPNPATHHAPPITHQCSHLSCSISTSRYVLTCLYHKSLILL